MGDVLECGFAEENPRQRDHGMDSRLGRIPESSEGDSLAIWPGLVPSVDPDYV